MHVMSQERGRCPRCGSGEVWHAVTGLPPSAEWIDELPEWAGHTGCLPVVYNRGCEACGLGWNAPPEQGRRPT